MKLFSKNQSADQSILAIVSDPGLAGAVDAMAQRMTSVAMTMKRTDDPVADAGRLINGSADVVIVEADMQHPQVLKVLQRLTTYVGNSGSLLTVIRNGSAASVRQLFRLGISDVLELPVGADELSKAVSDLLKAPRRTTVARRANRVISVLGCGGGAGASMVAANVAHTFANRMKARSGTRPKILLVDFDPQFGNLATIVDRPGNAGMLDLIQAGARLDRDYVASSVRSISEDFDLLAAPADILPLSALSKDFCERFLDTIRGLYDYVFLDHAQNWGVQTQPVLARSDAILFTLRPCLEHAERAQAMLRGLTDMNVSRDRVIVVANQARGLSHKDRIDRIEESLSRPLLSIPFDEKCHRTARDTSKFLSDTSGAKHQVKALSALADKTLEIINSATPDADHAPAMGAGAGGQDHNTLGAQP